MNSSADIEKLKKIIKAHLRRLEASEDIDQDRDLKEYGLDSMQAMNVLYDIEDTFAVTFDDSKLVPEVFKSVSTLHSAVASLREA